MSAKLAEEVKLLYIKRSKAISSTERQEKLLKPFQGSHCSTVLVYICYSYNMRVLLWGPVGKEMALTFAVMIN